MIGRLHTCFESLIDSEQKIHSFEASWRSVVILPITTLYVPVSNRNRFRRGLSNKESSESNLTDYIFEITGMENCLVIKMEQRENSSTMPDVKTTNRQSSRRQRRENEKCKLVICNLERIS